MSGGVIRRYGPTLQLVAGVLDVDTTAIPTLDGALYAHLAGTETLTGAKTFDVAANLNGGVQARRRVTAIDTTLTSTDLILGCTSTGAPRTFTLPLAASALAGRLYIVKDEAGGAGANALTLARAGADLIDGATSKAINTARGSLFLYSDGIAGWHTIGGGGLSSPLTANLDAGGYQVTNLGGLAGATGANLSVIADTGMAVKLIAGATELINATTAAINVKEIAVTNAKRLEGTAAENLTVKALTGRSLKLQVDSSEVFSASAATVVSGLAAATHSILGTQLTTAAPVCIGANATPRTWAACEFQSTTKGVLPARLTSAQETTLAGNLVAADEGMSIYNTDTDRLRHWTGAAFVDVGEVLVASEARGDLLARGASTWGRLAQPANAGAPLLSGGTGADSAYARRRVVEGTVGTTDATLTTVLTIPLATSGASMIIDVLVCGTRTSGTAGSQAAGYRLVGTYRNQAGALSSVPTFPTVAAMEDNAAWDCALSASGTNVLVRVTGAAAVSITWVASATVIYSP